MVQAHRVQDTLVRLGRSAVVQFLGMAISSLFSLGTTVVVSRRLGYDDLGFYALGFGAAFYAALLSRAGLDTAAVHFPSVLRGRNRRVDAAGAAWACLEGSALFGIIGSGLLWVSAPLLASLIRQPELAGPLRAFAPSVVAFNLLQVGASALRGDQRVGSFVALRFVLFPVGVGLLTLAALLLRPTLTAAIVAFDVGVWLAAIVTIGIFRRTFPRAARPPDVRVFSFGLWIFATQTLQVAIVWADVLVVGYFLDSEQVGFYRVASQVALVVTMIGGAFETLYGPISATLADLKDWPHLREVGQGAARVVFFFTSVAAVGALLSPETVLAPFGTYVGPVIVPFLVLVAAHTLSSSLGPAPNVLVMGGRPKAEAVANAFGFAAGLGMAILLTPQWGVVGAAVATSIGILVRDAVRMERLWTLFRLTPASGRLAGSVAAWSSVLLAGLLVRRGMPEAHLAIAACSSVLLMALLWTFFLPSGDRRVLRDVAWRRPLPVAPEPGAL